MRYLSLFLAAALCGSIAAPAVAAPVSKDALKEQIIGICLQPETVFPTSIPAAKRAAFDHWCDCVSLAIDRIPEDKLSQATADTMSEYPLYKADPKGFVPSKEYSLLRVSKACIQKRDA